MKIGVLGSGDVGTTLAAGFVKHGHQVTLGTRDISKLNDWQRDHQAVTLGSFADAAKFAELAVLAVKGSASADVLRMAGVDRLHGKIVIDATNPITDMPPVNGVLSCFTTLDDSLLERLQNEYSELRLVKAFNSVGSDRMVDPDFGGTKPTMFICGNDATAKATVTQLLDQLGWETADMGKVEAARVIEPLAILWCIPGFLNNQWTHAFKLLK